MKRNLHTDFCLVTDSLILLAFHCWQAWGKWYMSKIYVLFSNPKDPQWTNIQDLVLLSSEKACLWFKQTSALWHLHRHRKAAMCDNWTNRVEKHHDFSMEEPATMWLIGRTRMLRYTNLTAADRFNVKPKIRFIDLHSWHHERNDMLPLCNDFYCQIHWVLWTYLEV